MLTIVLYENIGEGDATAKAVLNAIHKAPANDAVTVAINSAGGSVFEGEAIFNALRRHKGHTTARIDALAASAASYIAMACNDIVMAPGSHMMIHSPLAHVRGNPNELRDIIGKLEVFEKQMMRVYAQRSGQDEAKVGEWMRAETWFTAEQAMQAGFCDRVDDDLNMAAVIPGDFSKLGYRHIPIAVKALNDPVASGSAKEMIEQKKQAAKPELTAEQKEQAEVERARRQRLRKRHAMRSYLRPQLDIVP